MKSILILISLFIVSNVSIASVGNKDLYEIRGLTKAGQFQQALEKHLWFHEESKSSPGMAGVRLSYAIAAWVELGEKYSPAMEALIQIRDQDREKLLSGNGSFENFHDLSSINREIGDEEATLELFLILDEKYSEQSDSYYIVAEDLLIRHKKYDICAKHIGDPIVKYEKIRHLREMQLSSIKTNPNMSNPHILEHTDTSYIDGVLKLIEVLIAINQQENAIEIQTRALSYFPNESIKLAIQ